MKVYLDNCSFNRPFDNQVQLIIRLETEAKLFIQTKIVTGEINLIWSYILEYENSLNPFPERKEMIMNWKKVASETILESPGLLLKAKEIQSLGLKPKDSLHVACAVDAYCDYFITTDRGILKKINTFEKVRIISPINFINIWEDEK
jgi:predicted nucleic acid-binding protein